MGHGCVAARSQCVAAETFSRGARAGALAGALADIDALTVRARAGG
jgi:hypothetical protein